jgi:hypothetical protein
VSCIGSIINAAGVPHADKQEGSERGILRQERGQDKSPLPLTLPCLILPSDVGTLNRQHTHTHSRTPTLTHASVTSAPQDKDSSGRHTER